MSDPVLLGELSWVDVVGLAAEMPLVVLPVGAVEQHGPHLPLLVDSVVVEALAMESSRRTGVVVAPTVLYSSSQGHSSLFPGTLALGPATAQAVLEDICRWLAAAGFTKLFVLNGHLGNTGVLWNAVDELVAVLSPGVSVAGRSWWDLSPQLWDDVSSDAPTSRSEFHANWAETALMLHLRPDLVRMDRAVDHDEQDWAFAYDMSRKSLSGSIGRGVTRATAADGRRLFEHAADVLTGVVTAMLSEQPPPPAPTDVADWRLAEARRITGEDASRP